MRLMWLRRLHGVINDKKKFLTINVTLKKSKRKLKRLKGIHKGKRCFIIGNGPSLKVDDLEKLDNEISFACNGIYYIFDKSTWRPDYYCVQDYEVIIDNYKKINEVEVKRERFIGWASIRLFDIINDFVFYNLDSKEFYPNKPNFSEDPVECICDGYTITYSCIQLAVYMGFSEIILLGVDHNYAIEMDINGRIIRNDSIKDHFDDRDSVYNSIPALFKTTVSYEKAKEICDLHSVKIFNATRGGKLEVFPRVDFDSLF